MNHKPETSEIERADNWRALSKVKPGDKQSEYRQTPPNSTQTSTLLFLKAVFKCDSMILMDFCEETSKAST